LLSFEPLTRSIASRTVSGYFTSIISVLRTPLESCNSAADVRPSTLHQSTGLLDCEPAVF
jgi:hypothetical protein